MADKGDGVEMGKLGAKIDNSLDDGGRNTLGSVGPDDPTTKNAIDILPPGADPLFPVE